MTAEAWIESRLPLEASFHHFPEIRNLNSRTQVRPYGSETSNKRPFSVPNSNNPHSNMCQIHNYHSPRNRVSTGMTCLREKAMKTCSQARPTFKPRWTTIARMGRAPTKSLAPDSHRLPTSMTFRLWEGMEQEKTKASKEAHSELSHPHHFHRSKINRNRGKALLVDQVARLTIPDLHLQWTDTCRPMLSPVGYSLIGLVNCHG